MTRRTPKRIALLVFTAAWLGITPANSAEGPETWEGFQRWLAADPVRPGQVAALDAFLAEHGVKDVAPTWQLLRANTSWRRCGAPFAVPDRTQWANMVPALAFIKDRIIPAIGPVEAVSVYRDPATNDCSGGARGSAHRTFHAVDLIPERPFTQKDLAAALCPIHAAHGPRSRIGLGLYSGVRFHIDARGFRTWGPDHHRSSSPCIAP